jgi:hypothetical protein
LNIEFETAKFGEDVVPGALARFLEHGLDSGRCGQPLH